jgi:hypothetical protein
MPILVSVDRRRKIVFAIPSDTLTHLEMVRYQKLVWSQAAMRGFDEVIDLSEVGDVAYDSPFDVLQLADLSAETGNPKVQGRIAIVAADRIHHALGRMYQAYREMNPRGDRKVEIFRSIDRALEWLRPRPHRSGRRKPISSRASRRRGTLRRS